MGIFKRTVKSVTTVQICVNCHNILSMAESLEYGHNRDAQCSYCGIQGRNYIAKFADVEFVKKYKGLFDDNPEVTYTVLEIRDFPLKD